jgi:hypothetical protein
LKPLQLGLFQTLAQAKKTIQCEVKGHVEFNQAEPSEPEWIP